MKERRWFAGTRANLLKIFRVDGVTFGVVGVKALYRKCVLLSALSLWKASAMLIWESF